MNIGLDARLLSYRRGMGNFLYNLIVELSQLDPTNQYTLYTNQPHHLTLPANFQTKIISMPSYPLWEQIALPLAARRDNIAVLHCPANTGPLWLSPKVRLVLTIHDVMYLLPTSILPRSPSVYQQLGRLYRRTVVPLAIKRADAIVTDSYYSRQDIVQYLKWPETKIQVVWGAPHRACQVITDPTILADIRAKYALHQPFILGLGGVDPRKNTTKIIEAFALLKQDLSGLKLLLVGLPHNAQASFRQQAANFDIADQVIFAGFVPEMDLVALYNLAELLVYPSLYEGFGLPVLEAMACGTPVVTAPSGSIPEVAGASAIFVDPTNATDLSQAMSRILSDPPFAQRLRDLGFAQVKQFSWQRAAVEMLQIYTAKNYV